VTQPACGILIRNAGIADGAGAACVDGGIAICGARMARSAAPCAQRVRRGIDAAGLVVARARRHRRPHA